MHLFRSNWSSDSFEFQAILPWISSGFFVVCFFGDLSSSAFISETARNLWLHCRTVPIVIPREFREIEHSVDSSDLPGKSHIKLKKVFIPDM
jgi:hypothetical protein